MCVDVDRYMVSLYIHGWWNGMSVLKTLLLFHFSRKFRPQLAELPPRSFTQQVLSAPHVEAHQ